MQHQLLSLPPLSLRLLYGWQIGQAESENAVTGWRWSHQ